MTTLLEKAIARIRHLPAEQQDAIAQMILEEIEEEATWNKLFSNSQDLLKKMMIEAEEEDKAGLTENFNGIDL